MKTKQPKIESSHHTDDSGDAFVSVKLPDGRGFDAYVDGSVIPWDGNGAFTICEATGNVYCFSERDQVKQGLEHAESELRVDLEFGVVI
jgi:hypothetical protein